MLRSEKQESVADLERVYRESGSVVVTHYHGLTVAQLNILRKELKSQGAGFQIVKNTLSKIAAKKAGICDVSNLFSGPSAVAYSTDQVAAAKVVVEFAKRHNKLKIIGAVVDNKILDQHYVSELATLPSLDEVRSKLVAVLLTPATNITRLLQAPAAQIARLCEAFSEKQ